MCSNTEQEMQKVDVVYQLQISYASLDGVTMVKAM